MIIQLNTMIADIDNKNKDLQFLNILQLKWILYNRIQKKNYKNKFKIIVKLTMKLIILI